MNKLLCTMKELMVSMNVRRRRDIWWKNLWRT